MAADLIRIELFTSKYEKKRRSFGLGVYMRDIHVIKFPNMPEIIEFNDRVFIHHVKNSDGSYIYREATAYFHKEYPNG